MQISLFFKQSVKLETEEVITKINNIQSKSDDIVGWMNDVSKRLHLVNNDESQLEVSITIHYCFCSSYLVHNLLLPIYFTSTNILTNIFYKYNR